MLLSMSLHAQDKILLMNGQELDVSILSDEGGEISFEAQRKSGKMKEINLFKGDVFSFTKAGQAETVLYAKDDFIGNDYTVTEMRYLVYGQGDARNGYKSWPSAAGGFLFGVGGTLYAEGGYVPFVIFPLAYSFGMQIPYIKIKKNTVSDPGHLGYETYVEGYNKTARSKKFIHSFLATFAGVAVGAAIVELD